MSTLELSLFLASLGSDSYLTVGRSNQNDLMKEELLFLPPILPSEPRRC